MDTLGTVIIVVVVVIILCMIFNGNHMDAFTPTVSNTVLNIDVRPKDKSRPTVGSPLAYYVNGVQAPVLSLKRNVPYYFNLSNPNYPLYFTSSNAGSNWNNRLPYIINSPITQPTTVVFGNNVPTSFFYQSINNPDMGAYIYLS
jgi:hypothetical protein